jgi:serine/threonine protein kinase
MEFSKSTSNSLFYYNNKDNAKKNDYTPEDCNFNLKISKNELSDSSLGGDNFFPNISTKTKSENKNYLVNIKDNEMNTLCRKIDFSMDLESNDSKDMEEKEKNIQNFSFKDDSSTSMINFKNKSSEEPMETDEELDLRLIKKKSSKTICLTNSKFDEDYVIIKTLSEGENGKVYLCMRIQDNKTYVVKKSTSFTRKIDFLNLENLIKDISKNSDDIRYLYIHKYFDCWIEESICNEENDLKKYNTNKRIIYMVSNYCCNGNLVEFIQKIKDQNIQNYQNILNSEFYWDIVFQMMISLTFLHKLGHIHLDIKPTNYLVDANGILQLTDFGLSIKENEIDKLFTLYEYEGDSKYISPEMFQKQYNKINHKTDIFSLGLSIYELVSENNLPLNGEIWRKIRNEDFPQELYDKINKFDVNNNIEFIKLVKIMTNVDSNLRPNIEDIFKDEINFPCLNKRYKQLECNSFNLSYDVNKIPNIKCPKYDFSSNKVNIKDLFIKRSDSMKLYNFS